ncbi:MAG: MaoC family dehydratase [Bacteroidota bacterium]
MPNIPTQTPYSTTVASISELKEYMGLEIGLSPWITINQERIDQFAETTEDRQWIHIDPDRAAQFSPFGSTIAHGFLVLSFASKIVYDTYQVTNVKMGLNYGLDRVRFINPVRVNSQIRGRVRLLDLETLPNGGKLKVEITFEIMGEEKPACVAEFIGMVFV